MLLFRLPTLAAMAALFSAMAPNPLSADSRVDAPAVTTLDETRAHLFTGSARGAARMKSLLAAIDAAAAYGLQPGDYRSQLASGLNSRPSEQHEEAARRAFLDLAADTRDGRISPLLEFTDEEVARRTADHQALLDKLAGTDDVRGLVRSLRRDNPLQKRLARALERYRRYAREDAFSTVVLPGDMLEEGDENEAVVDLANRLEAEGFLQNGQAAGYRDKPVYDASLTRAVKRFQVSRGLVSDGIVGPSTLARLNETEDALVAKLLLNLERARWLPQDFAETYVLVNIIGYEMSLHHEGAIDDRMKVIVGTEQNQTPVFADTIEYIVLNPYWNVPESILRNEIAPKVAEDVTYLERKGFEAVEGWTVDAPALDPRTIAWNDLPEALPFRVRQKPSPRNALGQVKFMFPNDYSVYLHDTPADALFDKTERTFSHGCIRVARPKDFAKWVLERTGGDPTAADRIGKGDRERIDLDQHVPVYITYMTAYGDESDTVYFFDDVYGRDQRLKDALKKRS